MNCQDALSLLYEIIDKEASEIDVAHVKEHLEQCKHCFEVYKVEGAVQEFILEKIRLQEAAARAESLKLKLVAQLDEIDAESKREQRKLPFGNLTLLLAAAASLVIVVGAALFGASLYRHHNVYIPLEQAHWDARADLSSAGGAITTTTAVNQVFNNWQYSVPTNFDAFVLASGHVEEIKGVQMGHFVYSNGQEMVSVFVAPADEFSIPNDVKEHTIEYRGVEFYDHHCRGCRLVYHKEGDVVVVTATTDHTLDLTRFSSTPDRVI